MNSDSARALLTAEDRLLGAAEDLERLTELHRLSVESGVPVSGYERLSAQVAEHARAALDQLAYAAVEEFGRAGKRSSYPLAPDPSAFPKSQKESLPGLEQARGDLVALFEARQPYQPDMDWLRVLGKISITSKHQLYPDQDFGGPMHIAMQLTGEQLSRGIDLSMGPDGVPIAPEGAQNFDVDYHAVFSYRGMSLSVPDFLSVCVERTRYIVQEIGDELRRR